MIIDTADKGRETTLHPAARGERWWGERGRERERERETSTDRHGLLFSGNQKKEGITITNDSWRARPLDDADAKPTDPTLGQRGAT
jgi:hypothetical protein